MSERIARAGSLRTVLKIVIYVTEVIMAAGLVAGAIRGTGFTDTQTIMGCSLLALIVSCYIVLLASYKGHNMAIIGIFIEAGLFMILWTLYGDGRLFLTPVLAAPLVMMVILASMAWESKSKKPSAPTKTVNAADKPTVGAGTGH